MFGDTYLSIITDSHRFRTNKMSCRSGRNVYIRATLVP